MVDWIRGVFVYIEKLWQFFFKFFENLVSWFSDLLLGLIEDMLTAFVAILSVIPLPDALANFTWPDPGPLGCLLTELGFAQALSILAAAFVVRFLYSLIPLIHS